MSGFFSFYILVALLSSCFATRELNSDDNDDFDDWLEFFDTPKGDKKEPSSRVEKERESIYANKVRWRMTSIANRVFAMKLYAHVANSTLDQNILISPLVVSTGLSMTLLGANGRTEEEIMSTLEYSKMGKKRNQELYTKSDVPRLYETLLHRLNSSDQEDEDTFVVACRLFGEQTETFLPDFVSDTRKYYGAELDLVDFSSHPEESRIHINDWVAALTSDTIQEALPSGSVTSSTLLTLVSAAYFKGTWMHRFDEERTSSGNFYISDDSSVTVDYMKGLFLLPYRYSETLDCGIVILPYKSMREDFTVEMQLFLPEHPDALQRIENMGEDDLRAESRNMLTSEIEIWLPKFKFEHGIDLAPILQEMGLQSLFGNADLSGMNGKRNLNFGKAFHKGFIQVDENGTTASASFSSIMVRSIPTFIFNRPFFFLIREKSSNSILFMGRIHNPIG